MHSGFASRRLDADDGNHACLIAAIRWRAGIFGILGRCRLRHFNVNYLDYNSRALSLLHSPSSDSGRGAIMR